MVRALLKVVREGLRAVDAAELEAVQPRVVLLVQPQRGLAEARGEGHGFGGAEERVLCGEEGQPVAEPGVVAHGAGGGGRWSVGVVT